MKFYRVDYYVSDPSATATEWATSVAAADKIARDNRCGDHEAKITPIEVPITRPELLAFLNENVWTHPHATVPYGG